MTPAREKYFHKHKLAARSHLIKTLYISDTGAFCTKFVSWFLLSKVKVIPSTSLEALWQQDIAVKTLDELSARLSTDSPNR